MLYTLFVLLGAIAVVCGVISLGKAMLGVGIIGFGLFLGVLARILQADSHHAKMSKKIDAIADALHGARDDGK